MINVPRVNAPQIDPNMALRLTMPSINISPAINAYFNARKMRNQEAQQKVENERQVVADDQNNQLFDAKLNAFNANKPVDELNRKNALVSGQNQLNESINTYELKENEKFLTSATTKFANAKTNEEAFEIAENLKNDLIKKKEFITSQVPNATFNDIDGAISQLNEIQNNPQSAVGIVQGWNQKIGLINDKKQSMNTEILDDEFYLGDKLISVSRDKNTGELSGIDLSGNPVKKEDLSKLESKVQAQARFEAEKQNTIGQQEVINKADEEYGKAVSKDAATAFNTTLERVEGFKSPNKNNNLLQSLVSGDLKTGGFPELINSVKNYIGVGDGSDTEAKSQLELEIVGQLRETFGAQFTEREGAWLKQIQAAYNQSPNAVRKLLIKWRSGSIKSGMKDIRVLERKLNSKSTTTQEKERIDNSLSEATRNFGLTRPELTRISNSSTPVAEYNKYMVENKGFDKNFFNGNYTIEGLQDSLNQSNNTNNTNSGGSISPERQKELLGLYPKKGGN